jgi:hypothetical protein
MWTLGYRPAPVRVFGEVLLREFTPWSLGEVRAPMGVTAVGPVRVGRGEERPK